MQHRTGVRTEANRLAGMLAAPDLTGGIGRFLADRTFAALTARDREGRLWISPLTGPPGFLDATGETTLQVHASPAPGDALHGLAAGQPAGLLAIEFARRRRVRINGTLTSTDENGFTLEAEQAYGNCPQYIHPRTTTPASKSASAARRGDILTGPDLDLVRHADTFLLGTSHPERGNDASHRGGAPGFVTAKDSRTLWWPDYPGNNMFNSLGNLAVDPAAALLFFDFDSGRTLQVSGTAAIDWGEPRGVRLTVEAVVAHPAGLISRRT